MSAPPMENEQFQQVKIFIFYFDILQLLCCLQMPAVPPSYDQAMAGQGGQPYPPQGGVPYPPQAQPMYPPLPTEKGGVPPPAAGGQTTVVTQVQYVSAPRFGHRPVNMT